MKACVDTFRDGTAILCFSVKSLSDLMLGSFVCSQMLLLAAAATALKPTLSLVRSQRTAVDGTPWYDEIAGLIVGRERFMPLARPFHRAPHAACRPDHERELTVEHAARAEVPADVVRDHAHGVLGDAEHDHQIHFRAPRTAGAGVQRVVAGRRIVCAYRCARFHRYARHSRHFRLEACDVRRARERRGGGFGIARQRIEADVRARLVEHARRTGLRGR